MCIIVLVQLEDYHLGVGTQKCVQRKVEKFAVRDQTRSTNQDS